MTIGPKFEVGKYITLFLERTNRDKGLKGREEGGNYPPPSRFYKIKKEAERDNLKKDRICPPPLHYTELRLNTYKRGLRIRVGFPDPDATFYKI